MSTEHEYERILEGARDQNPPKDGLVNLLRIFSYFNKSQKSSSDQEHDVQHQKRV